MENASKALLIAGAMLITLLVLTVGMIFARKMSNQTSEIYDSLEQSYIDEFNQKFLAYEGRDLYIQDVVSIVNLAKNVNEKEKYPTVIQVKIPESLIEGIVIKDKLGNQVDKEIIIENAQDYFIGNIINLTVSKHLEDIYTMSYSFGNDSQYINLIEIQEKNIPEEP